MRHFDHDYVADVIRRLSSIRPDATPAWGTLTPQGMVAHLADTVRYAMGRGGSLPDSSSWFSRNIVRPLILSGMVRIPKNIKAPEPLKRDPRLSGGDIETLHALLDEYLSLVQAGEFDPKPHPYLGDIGIDGWARMHVLHFEHHLRQFGKE